MNSNQDLFFINEQLPFIYTNDYGGQLHEEEPLSHGRGEISGNCH
jgi:hypothetical protein